MAKQESKAARISRMIRCAFNEAEIGNEKTARSYWTQAIKDGYVANPKTEKGLEIAIAKGLRETRKEGVPRTPVDASPGVPKPLKRSGPKPSEE